MATTSGSDELQAEGADAFDRLLTTLGSERGFRAVFEARSDFRGRYAALSHSGLMRAALDGVDVGGRPADPGRTVLQALQDCGRRAGRVRLDDLRKATT